MDNRPSRDGRRNSFCRANCTHLRAVIDRRRAAAALRRFALNIAPAANKPISMRQSVGASASSASITLKFGVVIQRIAIHAARSPRPMAGGAPPIRSPNRRGAQE